MKKIFILVLLLFVTNSCFAQSVPVAPAKKAGLNASTIVRDSTGKQLTYEDWSAMLHTRKYMLKSTQLQGSKDTPEYMLVAITTEQSNVMFAAINKRKPAESEQFHAGDVFKPFSARDLNGEKFDMKKMAGKVFVINFWFIGCPPCRAEIPDLNKIADKYKDNKDVVFLAVCLDLGYDVKDFIKTTPFNYHILDGARWISERYGVHLYPTNVIVNRDGKVAYSSVSNQPSNPYWMTKTIDEALQASVTTSSVVSPTK